MGKKNKGKKRKIIISPPPALEQDKKDNKNSFLPWLFIAVGITAIFFFPVLKNDFTNWDDEFYVVNNSMLRGPDWQAIFTQPVAGNYHPLTMISLALNYQLTGLNSSSYLWGNYLLHLINTALVFYFVWILSGKKIPVAIFTAVVFGIHPMHVESVAWVSERKDVLYTLFFLLSLFQYSIFLQTGRRLNFWFCFLLFILSLLSKPAAIILPLVLLLLDYWHSRPITLKVIGEKVPFLLVSLFFAILTVKIQSPLAIAGLDLYPLWSRFFLASYAIMVYFFRFFIPYPLSAFHPYPPPDNLGWPIYLSPLFVLALLGFLWFQRKNKIVIFGFLFFIANLLLVLQLVTFGPTVISERYTYVPYIGLAFMLGMWLNGWQSITFKKIKWLAAFALVFAFAVTSFFHISVWRNSGTLWTAVIKHYPFSAIPRTNRANYAFKLAQSSINKSAADSLYKQALEDCNVALRENPRHIPGYQNRINILLTLLRDKEALADAESLIKLDPGNYYGYLTNGMVYSRINEPDKAMINLNKCISIKPDSDQALNLRGGLLVDKYQKFSEALSDFNRAISLNPKADYFLNRSICYYRQGDLLNAKIDAERAAQMGVSIPVNFKSLLKL